MITILPTEHARRADRRIRSLQRRAARDLREARMAFIECHASMQSGGIDAKLVPVSAGWLADPILQVDVIESYERLGSGRTFHRTGLYRPLATRKYGIEADRHDARLFVRHGLHDVVLAHGLHAIAVPVEGDSESAHCRSVSRLRTLARREELRVQVRDHEVVLLDPLGNDLHRGDVLSGFAFIVGIDLANLEEW